jgi:hypothetical protein
MLHAGLKNTALMLGVLLRFRAHKYLINADIKEMFLQFPVYERETETSSPSCGTKTRRQSQQSTSTLVTSSVRRARR